MAITDKAFGGSLLAIASILFTYYTLWVVVTPFVDADHPIQRYFPERYLAVAIPAAIFVLVVAVTGAFVGLVLARSSKKA